MGWLGQLRFECIPTGDLTASRRLQCESPCGVQRLHDRVALLSM